MDKRSQAVLYYLYMKADFEISAREAKLFNTICDKLELDESDKEDVIDRIKGVSETHHLNCLELLKKNSGLTQFGTLHLSLYKFEKNEEKATILWNLINLGYADTAYTNEEREVVDYLKKYWEIPDFLYQEMIDVVETCLALEEHQRWAESLESSSYKDEKLNQIKRDLKQIQDSIKITIAEFAL